ncbi:MAG: T9SS type A sorting domain-containing protein [Weeksellaceae bacterium]|nr:T9SS type A sorting domain-containing protein [Weeksellaceae bacterium]
MKTTLLILFFAQFSFGQVFPTTTLEQNGANNNRINIAVLADGYTSGQLASFQTSAASSVNYLFSKSPFSQYRNYFNAYAVNVVSAESGAKHPGTATDVVEPVIPVSNPNNYFGSKFDTSNVHRLLYSTNSGAITAVLAANVPDYDIALVLVNSPEYGGAGGTYAFSSTHASANEIVVHELGHSFGNLADEYWYAPTGESPNKTQNSNPATIKWKNWLVNNLTGIGIYPYSEAGISNWYRPHQNCEMRYLNQQFCSVCKEGLIEKIHSLVSMVDSYTPSNGSPVNGDAAIVFNVTRVLPNPNSLANKWVLNGSVLPTTGENLILNPTQLNNGNNTLVFTVTDDTALVRTDNHSSLHLSTITWTINKTTLGTSEIAAVQKAFSVYPVPSNEVIYIKGKQNFSKNTKVQLTDAAGRLFPVGYTSGEKNTLTVNLSGIASGTYLMTVTDGNQYLFSEKIIVQK